MKTLPLIGFLAACCVMSTVWAAEPAPAKPAAPAAATPAATPEKPATAESAASKGDEDPKVKEDETEDKAAADKGAAGKPKPSAADKAGDKSSPQRFVPSEQVRADFDVSFPIDI